jgi:hypothetical protein
MTEEITELFTEILISKIENRIADRLASHFQAENQDYQFEDVEIDRVERDFDRRRARRNAAANSNKLTFKHFVIGAGIVGVILKHLHNQRKDNQMLAAIHAKQQSKKQTGSSNGTPPNNNHPKQTAPAAPASSHVSRQSLSAMLKASGNDIRKIGGKNIGKASVTPQSSGEKIDRKRFSAILKGAGNDMRRM